MSKKFCDMTEKEQNAYLKTEVGKKFMELFPKPKYYIGYIGVNADELSEIMKNGTIDCEIYEYFTNEVFPRIDEIICECKED